jgi:restriction system protein
MTIVEAIIEVMNDNSNGMTDKEVYNAIIAKKLYVFGALDPVSAVRAKLRSHCVELDFPSASNRKVFTVVKTVNKTKYYGLISKNYNSSGLDIKDTDLSEMLPEEKMIAAYTEHRQNMKLQLLDMILDNDSYFFEKMVVDLLLKMGYGYDKSSGIVTKRTRDGGIDGIIKGDPLGLDTILIQAKRNKTTNIVQRDKIDQFIGAMGERNKGVFITTSSFSDSAIKKANSSSKNIILIDGDKLTNLMLAYGAGATVTDQIAIYKIDEDYFN